MDGGDYGVVEGVVRYLPDELRLACSRSGPTCKLKHSREQMRRSNFCAKKAEQSELRVLLSATMRSRLTHSTHVCLYCNM